MTPPRIKGGAVTPTPRNILYGSMDILGYDPPYLPNLPTPLKLNVAQGQVGGWARELKFYSNKIWIPVSHVIMISTMIRSVSMVTNYDYPYYDYDYDHY